MTAAHFKVDPKLASLLGEAYRSSEEALRELVDNAWDADAEHVKITLPTELSGGPIVVEDDGSGMTEGEVRDEYLYVANDRRSRKGALTTGKKRPVKGRKGIGKFAGLIAADTMTLETRARGRATRLTITKADLLKGTGRSDLNKVNLPIEVSDCTASAHGTKITLTGLAQNLAFPSVERLKQLLVVEYDRKEEFAISVNGEPVAIEDIPGQTFEHEKDLPRVGAVRLTFTVSEAKALKHAGIGIRIGGKIVGRPTMLGLEEDDTIPGKLLRRVYGEIEADGLAGDVTADWGAIIENSLGLGAVKEWASGKLREGVTKVFRTEINAQKARLAKELRHALDKLPENRRPAAERAVQRILERYYGDSDDRIKTVVNLMLEAFESDDYWAVLKSIDDATRADVTKLAEILDEFGVVDIAIVAQQAKRRLDFLDEFDRLIGNKKTVEKDVHTAIEKNLWLLGAGYRLIASNKSIAALLKTWMDETFTGSRAKKRPDLFLATIAKDVYLLVEFKRPSHAIDRDDETQAIKYRDDLAPRLPGGTIQALVVGGSRDATVATRYKTDDLRVVSYGEIVSGARDDLGWLVGQLRSDG
jgi:hypothetical protein